MSLVAGIAAILTIMQSVPGVVHVYPYVRSVTDEVVFKNLFFDEASQRIQGWTITRDHTVSTDMGIASGQDKHEIVIRGILGVRDADNTEKIFQDLIEAIRDAFWPLHKLQVGGLSQVFFTEPMQVRVVTQVMFAGALCHYCELTKIVEDFPR